MNKRTIESIGPVSSKRRRLVDSSVGKQNEAQKSILRPTGLSLNWNQNYMTCSHMNERVKKETMEITVGATGLKRGKKARTPKDVVDSASRLCRFNFLRRFIKCTNIQEAVVTSTSDKKPMMKSDDTDSTSSYMQYKRKTGCYIANNCFEGNLSGYIRSGNSDDFVIPHNHVTIVLSTNFV